MDDRAEALDTFKIITLLTAHLTMILPLFFHNFLSVKFKLSGVKDDLLKHHVRLLDQLLLCFPFVIYFVTQRNQRSFPEFL